MAHGYKKYMKKDVRRDNPLIKIFIVSFFGMLLFFTFVINYFSRVINVDTSIGDYKEQALDDIEEKKIVDMNSLEMIQKEDQGRTFTELMKKTSDTEQTVQENTNFSEQIPEQYNSVSQPEAQVPSADTVYKVYIGSYTSAEQAKVAKEIIVESGSGFSPIVKCIGTNEYTLQVGIFKNKQSADTMLSLIKKNNLPGRIIQE